MGKASKFKKIRRLAKQLPDIGTYQTVNGETLSGSELISRGVKEVQGFDVDPKLQYQSKKKIPVLLNHNRKMKQEFKKAGMAGAARYASAVVNYTQQKTNHEHNLSE